MLVQLATPIILQLLVILLRSVSPPLHTKIKNGSASKCRFEVISLKLINEKHSYFFAIDMQRMQRLQTYATELILKRFVIQTFLLGTRGITLRWLVYGFPDFVKIYTLQISMSTSNLGQLRITLINCNNLSLTAYH